MKMGLGLMLLLSVPSLPAQPGVPADPGLPDPVLNVEFSNPGLTPARWFLVLHPDGSAHFRSEPGKSTATSHTIEPGPIDRNVRLSPDFAGHVFETVRHRKLFNEDCESHLKVAFQGWKKITYSGPDGQGTCAFNYSKNKDIESLGDSFVAVASTIVEGARLELLLQHDPLGLDKEMEYLQEGARDGRLQQIGAIQAILTRLIEDPDVMERVRKRARLLLLAAAK
jgi:hypothetical protein